MFGLGFGEVLVILVVALLIFGPDKLPELARTLGKTMAELRRSMDEVRNEFHAPVKDFERSLRVDPTHPTAVSPTSSPNAAPAITVVPQPEKLPQETAAPGTILPASDSEQKEAEKAAVEIITEKKDSI